MNHSSDPSWTTSVQCHYRGGRFYLYLAALWILPAVCLALLGSIVGTEQWHFVSVQLVLGYVVAILPWRTWRPVLIIGALLLLCSVSISSLFIWHIGSLSWTAIPGNLSVHSLIDHFRGEPVHTWGNQQWTIEGRPSALILEFDATRASTKVAPSWFLSSDSIEITEYIDEGTIISRIAFPVDASDPYVMRTFDTGVALAGTSLRLRAELRSREEIPAYACRGMWLQTWYDGGAYRCQPTSIGVEWTSHELIWTVPAESKSSVVRILLNDFDGHELEVRNVALYRYHDGVWEPLEPLLPTTGYVRIKWEEGGGSESLAGEAIVVHPGNEWRTFQYALTAPLNAVSNVTIELNNGSNFPDLHANSPLIVKNASVRIADVGSAKQARSFGFFDVRQSWWFSHPNFAGHTLVVLMALMLTLRLSNAATTAMLLMSAFGILLTGSRAGLLGLGWLICWAIFFSSAAKQRSSWARVLTVGAGGLFIILIATGQLGRGSEIFSVQADVSRTQVMSAALTALADDPGGRSLKDFSVHWHATYPEASESVTHAHNMLLQLGFHAGLPGIIAGALFLAGYLALAVRAGIRYGLLLIPFFMLQTVDNTFSYAWIFIITAITSSILASTAIYRMDTPVLQQLVPPPPT